ncbi:hypothetical protein BAUCODRAFT_39511 [Baudoinia panamericana UAMH 10762]|uniref:Methyltransferase type 11 domain-containing protein n=1 Tax=Baudoinia panamericana (strain UAMH 10762) TaxID=717646 RepID=M2MJ87_BAUPA|nr:uncharacterized protein BAUCODRAFT_39511 [Baudoinia panamericana UAMH 10762]EMC91343.1 hypothetical protein BAUCODRAFT_39511 [Baudoinia panamericana UAMH 10762]
MAGSGLKDVALQGFDKSGDYDLHRPTYSTTAVQELLEQCRVSGIKRARVCDLAAGTGKFTEALLKQRDEQYEIIAIEPHDGMREILGKKQIPHVAVLPGTAEHMPLEDESVDVVIVAQAFHWFATKEALREIHRVLKPHGCFGMIWNIEDYNAPQDHKATTEWEGKVHALTWTFYDNEPRFRHQAWRKVFEDQSKSSPLDLIRAKEQLFALPLGEHVEAFETWLPKEDVWKRYSTISHISVLKGEERERTHQTVIDALNSPEVETNERGEVAVHGKTYVVWTSKIPEDGRASLTNVERPGA